MGEGSSRGGSFVLRNNGWIDIEMVKTLSRPLSQQQNPNRVGPIRKPGLDALALTLAVHTKGKGIAGTYTFEVAEEKQSEVLLMAKIEEHPLRVEVERA
jgi:hypothetical protein